jgi:sterol O-acyltransferase
MSVSPDYSPVRSAADKDNNGRVKTEEELEREKLFGFLTLCKQRECKPRESWTYNILYGPKDKGTPSLEGFYNLFVLSFTLFVVTHPVLTYLQKGEYFNTALFNSFKKDFFIVVSTWPLFTIWTFNAFILQKLVVRGMPLWMMYILQHLTQLIMFFVCIYAIIDKNWGVTHTTFILFQACIHFMKMHSYCATNIWMREEVIVCKKRGWQPSTPYPHNVNLQDFCYYLAAPVLVYWHHYPKTTKIRWGFFFERALLALLGLVTCYIMACEYIIPVFEMGQRITIVEAVLRMLIPIVFLSVIVFFSVWESMFSCFAELSRFADREFYKDWWNSTTFDEFNRKWNKVVHEFLFRHLYAECMYRYKLSKNWSQYIAFMFSACLHELIVAMIFRKIRPILFGFMILQLPLIAFGYKLRGTRFGNFFWWFGIALGIPLIMVLYLSDQFSWDYAAKYT